VNVNLLDHKSIEKAVQGATYIVHTASPFPLGNPRDPMQVIGPAVEGTKNIMVEALMQKVKRVVVTSSTAAIEAKN